MPKLIRITTVPISLKYLITGQMRYMQEKGLEVTMMSADGPEIGHVLNNEGCPHIIIPLTRQITPLQDLKALWILYKKLKKIKPDIVHSHTPKAGLIGMLAAWLARVPVRLHTVAGLPLESATGPKKQLLLFIEKLTYAFSTEVWPNSQSLKKFIENHKLVRAEKLRIIGSGSSNGIDISEFDPSNLDQGILKEIQNTIKFDDQNTYLLFVGRMVKDKGIEELVMAFTILKRKFKNLKLVLVGPLESHLDPLSDRTLEIIESEHDIITPGFSNQVKYYMHLADLFVFPSHREGFPNVPMQAAVMNCPIVASRITGNVDIIEDGVDGLLHKKGDVDDLVQKIEYALYNKEIMKNMTSKLRTKIFEKFDRKVVHEEILATYLIHLKKNGIL